MTAEVLKYTMAQVEALELAPARNMSSSKAPSPRSRPSRI